MTDQHQTSPSDAAPVWGMTHNLGGFPSQNVSSVTIVGQYGA